MGWLIGIGAVVLIIGAWLTRTSRYYARMFAEDSFLEFHEKFARALASAEARMAQAAPPNLEDASAFITRPGLAVGVSVDAGEGGGCALAVSMSQAATSTTHSVCGRYGFFVLAMLRTHELEVTPFYTPSGVHHMHIVLPSSAIELQDFESTYDLYTMEGRPIPFEAAP